MTGGADHDNSHRPNDSPSAALRLKAAQRQFGRLSISWVPYSAIRHLPLAGCDPKFLATNKYGGKAPGLGALAVSSVDNQDLPVIIALVMLAAAFIVVANIVVDIFYAFLDPRARVY